MNQTNQKNTWSRNDATILSAMEFLTCKQQLAYSWDDPHAPYVNLREDAITYLQERLNMTRLQVQIVTCILYHAARSSGQNCDMDDLAGLLHLHPLRIMRLIGEFDQLEKMGYILGGKSSDQTMFWSITIEAKDAIMEDRQFELESIKLATNFDFLVKSFQFIGNATRYDSDGIVAKNISRLMMHNSHLTVAQNLNKIKEDQDRWCMLQMMTTLGVKNDDYISFNDLDDMLERHIVHRLLHQMQGGNHPFVQNEYIEPYCQDGLAQENQWVLTKKGWTAMLGNQEDVEAIMPKKDTENAKLLTSYQKLTERPLYFSGKTEDQVNTLSHLLQEEQFANIRQALKKRGMPTGFCCLFYGTPGTGKTELVQQLAIATKRDLLQVNLSTLRDKYVGESEKQVKRIFDQYRSLVRSQERAPILFFNEADAILGNRMENTQRAVDKMENAIQNIILQEMEQLEGIMICTTNLTSCLDKAFDRRFIYKIEFEKPTSQARKLIWQSMLSDLNDYQAAELASKYDFSGGQIQNISRKQVINAIFSGKDNLDYEQIKQDCLNESISRNSRGKVGF